MYVISDESPFLRIQPLSCSENELKNLPHTKRKDTLLISKAYYQNYTQHISNIKLVNKCGEIELRPYQLQAEQFLLNNIYGILSLDLGMGKTIVSLATLKALYNNNPNNFKALIICPLTLLPKWNEEIEKMDLKNIDITIINYEQLRLESKNILEIVKHNYNILIIDEATHLRNKTLFKKGLKYINADRIYLLSGLLIEKNPLDLFNIVNTFYPYFNYKEFNNSFVIREEQYLYSKGFTINKIVGFKNLDVLRQQLKPIYFRLTREEANLPETTIYNENINVDISEKTRNIYNNLLNEINDDEENIGMFANYTNIRLLLDDENFSDKDKPILSNKFNELIKIIENTKENIIIFSSYKITTDKIYNYFKAHVLYAKSVVYINHDINTKNRNKLLFEYKTNEEKRILLTTDILSHGVDIDKATLLINYNTPLKAGTLKQRLGRLNRGIDNKAIRNITLMTNTYFDRRVNEIVATKLSYNDEINMNIENSVIKTIIYDIKNNRDKYD